jgi:arylsulfatase A-like enzyme
MTDKDSQWRGPKGSDTYYSFQVGRLPCDQSGHYHDNDWAWVQGACELIRNGPKDKPLCIYLPLVYPHPPYAVEEPWYSAIDRDKLPPRILGPENWDAKPAMLRGIAQVQALEGWTEERWTELRATYYGMCARVDYQFGMVLQALRQAGIYDDTAVFLFADHGDFTGDYGLVEKTQNTFEDVLARVPLVIKPPRSLGVRPRVTGAMAELIDFTATAYELAGVNCGYTHFGRSLVDVLRGSDVHRDAVFCEGGRLAGETHCMELQSTSYMKDPAQSLYWPRLKWQQGNGPEHGKAIMCRTERYKYVRRLYERDELYDLGADPGERNNRIDDPALAPVAARLRERMLTWFVETSDVVPWTVDKR